MQTEFILLSGGLDSSLLAHELMNTANRSLRGLYVNHGQRASAKEIEAANNVANFLDIPLKVIDASGLWPSFADVAGKERYHLMTSSAISPSPGLLIGATYAAWADAKTLYVGLVKEDIDGRPWLLDLLGHYNSAMSCIRPSLTGNPPGGNEFDGFKLVAPMANRTKQQVIEGAVSTNSQVAVDELIAMTWSCQFSDIRECGECFICRTKKSAIALACSAKVNRSLSSVK